MNAHLSISLDAQSVWAVFRGDEYSLSIIENILAERILQDFGERGGISPLLETRSVSRSVSPWVRKGEELYVMAGLVPWCFPERRYPRLWDDSYALLNSRLSQLDEWGWRDYQVEAVRAAVLAPLGRGIVSVGTGGGKSRIAWGIAYCCGGSWQYVVYGRDLVRQAKEVFSELTAKYMSEGGAASPASIEVWSWAKLPLDGTGVLVDECHMASATQRSRRLAAGRWGYRIGLSGSALDRADALNPMTVGFFGLEVARISVDELVEDGYLAAGVVRIVYV